MTVSTVARLAAVAVASAPLFSSAGWAYPDSLKMTCSQAQQYVAKNGSAVLATGAEFSTFSQSCMGGIPAYARTKDAQFCFVGLYCDSVTIAPFTGYFQGTNH